MMHYVMITIKEEQYKYIKSHYFRLSPFIQDKLQEIMDKDINYTQNKESKP